MNRNKIFLLLGILFLPNLGLLLNLDKFAYTLLNPYSDITISHYPNAVYLLNMIEEFGQIPLWSNTILSGYPFAANPLAGIWYPFGWLAYLLALPQGFNLSVGLHLMWGAVGMFFLLKQRNVSDFAAITGAVLFEVLPRIWAHYGAGHLSMIYAVCWTPWLIWSELNPTAKKKWIPGIIMGIIALADVRWFAYAGTAWGITVLAQFRRSPTILFLRSGLRLMGQPLMSLGFSAPLLVPMLEYTMLSTRWGLASSESLAFSLQPSQFLGLMFPDFTGFVEWVIYPGALCIVAFLWTWLDRKIRKKTGLMRWSIVTTLLLSLGENFLPSGWLLGLPGFSLLRVPPRFMILGGLLLCILTADWIHILQNRVEPVSVNYRWVRLGLVGLVFFSAALAGVMWLVTGAVPVSIVWGTICYCVLVPLSFLIMKTGNRFQWVLMTLLFVGLLDTIGINTVRMNFRSLEGVAEQSAQVAEYLAKQSGRYRVYSPSYSLPQEVAATYRLELADGIDPLQLKKYTKYFEEATGVEGSGYSVTLPGFKTANPEVDNQDALPSAELLGLLNVRYVVAEYDLAVEGLDLARRIGRSRIYENKKVKPRAWVVGAEGQPIINEAAIKKYSPNEIVIVVNGPGQLVLSEINYPGWMAFVDGREAVIVQYQDVLRSVNLTEGSHSVTFVFQPLSLWVGMGIFVITVLVFIIHLFRLRKHD